LIWNEAQTKYMVDKLQDVKDEPIVANKDAINLNSLPLHLTQMEKMASIGQLSSSVAHEMRNLLGMIRTAAFNIERAVKQDDEHINKNLEVITRSVIRAREFIDNLLNLSSVPRGKQEVIDIHNAVDNLLTLFSKEFEWRSIRLERNYSSIPFVLIDCHSLQECLLNLILNAIQSIDDDGVITIEIKPLKQGIKISISDTGCGISKDYIDRIFDQFYTSKKSDQGTGLGLTIARSLTQDMGGDITVTSQVGKGSQFCVCLPSLQTCTDKGVVLENKKSSIKERAVS